MVTDLRSISGQPRLIISSFGTYPVKISTQFQSTPCRQHRRGRDGVRGVLALPRPEVVVVGRPGAGARSQGRGGAAAERVDRRREGRGRGGGAGAGARAAAAAGAERASERATAVRVAWRWNLVICEYNLDLVGRLWSESPGPFTSDPLVAGRRDRGPPPNASARDPPPPSTIGGTRRTCHLNVPSPVSGAGHARVPLSPPPLPFSRSCIVAAFSTALLERFEQAEQPRSLSDVRKFDAERLHLHREDTRRSERTHGCGRRRGSAARGRRVWRPPQ